MPEPVFLTRSEMKLLAACVGLMQGWLGKEYGPHAEEDCIRLFELFRSRIIEDEG